MCTDTMATTEVKRFVMDERTNCWRRKKSVFWDHRKAAVRKYIGKWSRKPRHRVHHSLKWEKEKQSGAMAPRNTTQYLMELVYCDLNITELSSRQRNRVPLDKHMYSYTSPYTEQDTMDFQQQDFESVFQNEL